MMLDADEMHVIDLTVELTNAFCKLDDANATDKLEFIDAMHRIQDMVMARPVRKWINGIKP